MVKPLKGQEFSGSSLQSLLPTVDRLPAAIRIVTVIWDGITLLLLSPVQTGKPQVSSTAVDTMAIVMNQKAKAIPVAALDGAQPAWRCAASGMCKGGDVDGW